MLRRLLGHMGQSVPRSTDGFVLRLKYPVALENISLFAADIVESARAISAVELDYSPESLAAVDQILEGFRSEGVPADQILETLFGFGCYVGEVFVRRANGIWRRADELPMKDITWPPFFVQLPNEQYCNPLAKVFKRVENGAIEDIPYFYRVFTAPSESGRAPAS